MATTYEEKNLLNRLQFLETNSPNTYENLLHLMDTTYRMQIVTIAEQQFLHQQLEQFTCFDFKPEDEAYFRRMYGVQINAKPYIYYSEHSDYCGIFFVDAMGIIRFKKDIFDPEELQDLMMNFYETMHKCMPLYHMSGGLLA